MIDRAAYHLKCMAREKKHNMYIRKQLIINVFKREGDVRGRAIYNYDINGLKGKALLEKASSEPEFHMRLNVAENDITSAQTLKKIRENVTWFDQEVHDAVERTRFNKLLDRLILVAEVLIDEGKPINEKVLRDIAKNAMRYSF